MEACEEDFIFLLDDNFLTNKQRLERLCEELEERKLGKYWMTQGRTDFIAKVPRASIARLADVGLAGILSGYETNDEDALEELQQAQHAGEQPRWRPRSFARTASSRRAST